MGPKARAIAVAVAYPKIPTNNAGKTRRFHCLACAMAAAIRDRKVSCVELLTDCLERIEQVNGWINAVVQTCPERALEEAKKWERARKAAPAKAKKPAAKKKPAEPAAE